MYQRCLTNATRSFVNIEVLALLTSIHHLDELGIVFRLLHQRKRVDPPKERVHYLQHIPRGT